MAAFAFKRSRVRMRLKPSKYRPNTKMPAESIASATQTSIKVKPDFWRQVIAGSIGRALSRRK